MTRHHPLILLVLSCLLPASAPAQGLTQPSSRPAWTLLFPGAHRIYVSSSTGSDANNGAPLTPFKTLTRAVQQVHDGDDLLLKRGDVFHESFGNHRWSHVTLGAYGIGPRPTVLTDTKNQSCFVNLNGQNVRIVGLHLAASHRDPSQSDFHLVEGQYGVYCMNCNNVLVEDCLIEYFNDCLAIQGNANTGFRLRRSVIRQAYSAGKAFAQGIFLDGQKNAVIEDTVFDTCGWNPLLQAEYERRKKKEGESGGGGEGGTKTATTQPSTRSSVSPSPPLPLSPSSSSPSWVSSLQARTGEPFPGTTNIFNHAIYNNTGNGAGPSIIRNCIFVNAASTAVQQRPGGTIDNCLFIHNGLATDAFTSGEQGQITNCVVLGSQSCPAWAWGGGLTLFSHSGKLANNIIAHGSPPQYGAAIVIDLPKGQENSAPPDAQAIIDHNIIYDWPADGLFIFHTRPQVQFTNNVLCQTPKRQVEIIDMSDAKYQFSANVYEQSPQKLSFKQKPMTFAEFAQATAETNAQQPAAIHFVDPTRTIESYAKLLGLPPTLADFMNAADTQARDHWDPRLTAPVINDYFREGFALKQ